MNAVEIEEAISALAEQAFDPVEFPFAFLQAFGNKETTIKRLRSGASNKSEFGGGVDILVMEGTNLGAAKPVITEGELEDQFVTLAHATSGHVFVQWSAQNIDRTV